MRIHREKAAAAVAAAVAAALAGAPAALANPTGAQVTHGQAVLHRPDAATLEIHNSDGAIIRWQDFSIGAGETTRFVQPDAASRVLNRVVGEDPSRILGQLVSNGRVFLINPNGIVFGAGARVDTAGLIASSLNLSDLEFLRGHYRFSAGDSAGAVVNRGFIRAGRNGQVLLIAPDVENSGIIHAEGGRILLAAGRSLTLTDLDSQDITFEVQAPTDRAVNLGQLLADDGAAAIFAAVIQQSGRIQANRLTRDADGTIRLVAGRSLEAGGVLSAAGRDGAAGGRIEITGPETRLASATLIASGERGGTVLVGGDYQGGGALPRARTTTVDADSAIHADATGRGKGGRVIVWSEAQTRVDGRLSARGGPRGGDGGLVETSSRGRLDFARPADVAAPRGRPGTWLIDPEDITIDGAKAASISSALNQGSSVSIQTAEGGEGRGDITVASAIEKTAGGDAGLSLTAHRRIEVNAPITSTAGKLDVSLRAGQGIAVNSTIATNGGSVSSTLTGEPAGAPVPGTAGDTTAGDGSPPPADAPAAADTGTAAGTPTGELAAGTPVDAGITDGTPIAGATDDPGAALDPAGGDAAGADAPGTLPDPLAGGDGTPVADGTPGDAGATDGAAVAGATDDPGAAPAGDGDAAQLAAGDAPAPAGDAAGADPAGTGAPEILIDGDIQSRGGDIRVDSGAAGTTVVSGRVDSSNADAGGQGGDIRLLGDRVGLFQEAVVDASGAAGGGEVLIGGDRQGANPEVRNASAVYVGERARVRSDALENGDGGKVIVFAEDSARIYGRLSARGGSQGGDGGFIETSGLKALDLRGAPDTGAPRGQAGTWLIDPYNITVTNTTTVNMDTTNSPWVPTASGANVNIADIKSGLNGGGIVRIATTNASTTEAGDIDWNADLDYNGIGATGSLILNADNDINFINGGIFDSITADSDALNVTLNATGNINVAQNIDARTADVTLNASGGVSQTGGSIKGNFVTIFGNGGDVSIQGNIAAGGTLVVTAANNLSQALATTVTGSEITYTATGGNITLQSDVTATNGVSLTAGGAISQTGGTITANTLTTTSSDATTGTNLAGVSRVSNFNATESGGGDILIRNFQDLTLTGLSTSGGGNASIKLIRTVTAPDYNLSITNPVNVAGNLLLDTNSDDGALVNQNNGNITVSASGGTATAVITGGQLTVKGNDLTLQAGNSGSGGEHADIQANGMNITLQGDLQILGGANNSDALLQNFSGDQVIQANGIYLSSSTTGEARLNNFGGNQQITTNGTLQNSPGKGLWVTSGGDFAEIYHNGSGSQDITVNTGDLNVTGNNGGDAMINATTAQNLNVAGALTIGASTFTGSSLVRTDGSQTVSVGGDVTLTGAGGAAANQDSTLEGLGGTMLYAAGVTLIGASGSGGNNKTAIRANASVDITATNNVSLSGGGGDNNETVIEGTSVNIIAAGVNVAGGTGNNSPAGIGALSGDVTMDVGGGTGTVSLTISNAGLDSDAVIGSATGNVSINAGQCNGCNILTSDPRGNGVTEAGLFIGANATGGTGGTGGTTGDTGGDTGGDTSTPPADDTSTAPDSGTVQDSQTDSTNSLLTLLIQDETLGGASGPAAGGDGDGRRSRRRGDGTAGGGRGGGPALRTRTLACR